MDRRTDLDEVRGFYAALVAQKAGCSDPRIERAFALVPREAFLPPGPWHVMARMRYLRTPSADPVYVYADTVIALDPARTVNNGEPSLHAAWMNAVEPRPGETVCHIGAGTGYYSAILSVLVAPGGRVRAYEVESRLVAMADTALAPYEGIDLVAADATRTPLPKADIVYVSAAVAAPPVAWLDALAPGGRMIFPWRPSDDIALTIRVRRRKGGWAVKPLMPSWFIACVGACSGIEAVKRPDGQGAGSVRSIWKRADRAPDGSAVAVYEDVWFSSDPAPE